VFSTDSLVGVFSALAEANPFGSVWPASDRHWRSSVVD